MSVETRSTRLQHMRRAAQAAPRHDERASRTSVTGGQVGWGWGGMGRKREVGGRPVRDRFEEEYIVWNYIRYCSFRYYEGKSDRGRAGGESDQLEG